MSSGDGADDAACLAATEFIDSDEPTVVALARSLQQPDPRATAVALFNWVRDHIRYDPYTSLDARHQYRASAVLARGSGYCVQKAVLLAALARACGIPARLGFADVRNHKVPAKLRQAMGTDLFVFHGYVELLLDGRWIKATPAFDAATTAKAGALLVELDGEHDATLHPVDPAGAPHIEYVRDRGSFLDVPFEEMRRVYTEVYGFAPEMYRG